MSKSIKRHRYLLGLATFSIAAAPVLTVVSCDVKNEQEQTKVIALQEDVNDNNSNHNAIETFNEFNLLFKMPSVRKAIEETLDAKNMFVKDITKKQLLNALQATTEYQALDDSIKVYFKEIKLFILKEIRTGKLTFYVKGGNNEKAIYQFKKQVVKPVSPKKAISEYDSLSRFNALFNMPSVRKAIEETLDAKNIFVKDVTKTQLLNALQATKEYQALDDSIKVYFKKIKLFILKEVKTGKLTFYVKGGNNEKAVYQFKKQIIKIVTSNQIISEYEAFNKFNALLKIPSVRRTIQKKLDAKNLFVINVTKTQLLRTLQTTKEYQALGDSVKVYFKDAKLFIYKEVETGKLKLRISGTNRGEAIYQFKKQIVKPVSPNQVISKYDAFDKFIQLAQLPSVRKHVEESLDAKNVFVKDVTKEQIWVALKATNHFKNLGQKFKNYFKDVELVTYRDETTGILKIYFRGGIVVGSIFQFKNKANKPNPEGKLISKYDAFNKFSQLAQLPSVRKSVEESLDAKNVFVKDATREQVWAALKVTNNFQNLNQKFKNYFKDVELVTYRDETTGILKIYFRGGNITGSNFQFKNKANKPNPEGELISSYDAFDKFNALFKLPNVRKKIEKKLNAKNIIMKNVTKQQLLSILQTTNEYQVLDNTFKNYFKDIDLFISEVEANTGRLWVYVRGGVGAGTIYHFRNKIGDPVPQPQVVSKYEAFNKFNTLLKLPSVKKAIKKSLDSKNLFVGDVKKEQLLSALKLTKEYQTLDDSFKIYFKDAQLVIYPDEATGRLKIFVNGVNTDGTIYQFKVETKNPDPQPKVVQKHKIFDKLNTLLKLPSVRKTIKKSLDAKNIFVDKINKNKFLVAFHDTKEYQDLKESLKSNLNDSKLVIYKDEATGRLKVFFKGSNIHGAIYHFKKPIDNSGFNEISKYDAFKKFSALFRLPSVKTTIEKQINEKNIIVRNIKEKEILAALTTTKEYQSLNPSFKKYFKDIKLFIHKEVRTGKLRLRVKGAVDREAVYQFKK